MKGLSVFSRRSRIAEKIGEETPFFEDLKQGKKPNIRLGVDETKLARRGEPGKELGKGSQGHVGTPLNFLSLETALSIVQ